ncbi:MAG: hypothetical protein JSV41_07240 [Gemmatimonadota bacterium]|nr:MAG: hypothetical protein JSV41_07240 [Gemmatimonadota bacterium]
MLRYVRILIAVVLLAWLWPATVQAQATGRVRVAQENFRREPNGTQLAAVLQGTEVRVLGEQGGWVLVELQGWIWAPSVGQTTREGFDLTVSASGGENLRASPGGRAAIKARLLEGCLLERVDASGNWIEVRRRGWLWRASLDISGTVAAAGPGEQEADIQPLITARAPLAVYATPDGDTIATFEPGAQAQVLGRTGDWIRIRVDGWVYGPAALDSATDLADTGEITPAQLRADPGRYRGALVRWRVQFISLRRAERSRTDFEEGEPFIHARGPAGDAGFVYLAVPEELLPIAESLEPLDYVTVVGRVRTGRSSLLGSPIIDLTDVEKEDTRR